MNDDQQLVSRLKKSDKDAMRNLYSRYGNYAYTIAYSLTENEADSAEITQEVFLKIWNNISRYDESRSGLRTWIAKIARNTAIDFLRKKRPESAGDDLELLLANIPSDNTPERSAIENEDSSTVKEAISKLPENQREIILLAYYSGLSQAEISEKTKLPLGTVKSRIRLGIIKLKEFLE